jgi:HAD superfamily hydrolase (TIGR01450 family)
MPGYLIDLDGTLVTGRVAVPGASELVRDLGDRFVVVSNNAEHTPVQLARHLRAIRLPIPAERIVLAGTTALEIVAAEFPRARVMVMGSLTLRRYAEHLGLQVTDDRPVVVVLARDRSFSFDKLMRAANAVRVGAKLILANPDCTHPGRAGEVVPETGALAAALLACTGPVPHRVIGKPEEALFRKAMALIGTDEQDTVMIGDSPDIDGVGAARIGLRYVVVRTGIPPRLEQLVAPSLMPDQPQPAL